MSLTYETYAEYLLDYPDTPISTIADIIQEEEDTNNKHRSIRRGLRKVRGREDEYVDTEGEEHECTEGKRWSLEGDVYYFYRDGEQFASLTKDEIDHVYTIYTKPNACTQSEVSRSLLNKFDKYISEDTFGKVKRILGLKQSSQPFPPHKYEEKSPEELNEEFFDRQEAKVQEQIERERESTYRKRWLEEQEKSLRAEAFAEEIRESVETLDVDPVSIEVERDDNLQACEIIIVISDWHIGQKIETEDNYFDREVARERIENLKYEIAEEARSSIRPISSVRVAVLGDMVDGVMGNMFDGQKDLQDLSGADQVTWAATHLASLLDFIHQVFAQPVDVYTVTGNHDRVGSDRDHDPKRFAGQMVYLLADSYCSEDVRFFNSDKVINTFRSYDTQVILTHGDRSPSNHRDMVWAHQDKDCDDYVVLSGHKHSFEVNQDTGIWSIQCPALCGEDEYSIEQIGCGSKPGQVMFEVRREGPRPATLLPV